MLIRNWYVGRSYPIFLYSVQGTNRLLQIRLLYVNFAMTHYPLDDSSNLMYVALPLL